MISVLILTLNNYAVAFNLDILRVRDDRNVKMLGNLRAYLSGIAVDRLTAGDDQIVLQISDRARKRGGCCPCVSRIFVTTFTSPTAAAAYEPP